jgi:hypothetical protein
MQHSRGSSKKRLTKRLKVALPVVASALHIHEIPAPFIYLLKTTIS